ncbi:ankyrin repeat domain-containing protein [Myroides injenensis]|uniref:ankyrin repeat domain-containing protein n=1 Tax=Myroides injenensis TaxID=1183151 RepID=UPI00226F0D69|nr:ankyrin repeat domain-containing protein [Myroides injenensis]
MRIYNKYSLLMCMAIFTSVTFANCSDDNNKEKVVTEQTKDMTTLFKAIEQNNIEIVKQELAKNSNLETKNSKGQTPLMLATYLVNNDIAFLLIDHGANVNTQDNNLNSPFLYAGAEGNLALVKKCLENGADFKVFNRYNGSALIPAAEKGHLQVVKLLVNTPDFPIDHVNRLGWTALMEAIVLSDGGKVHTHIVHELIKGGVNVNIKDHDGKTPLYHAKKRGFTEIVKLLEEAGAK